MKFKDILATNDPESFAKIETRLNTLSLEELQNIHAILAKEQALTTYSDISENVLFKGGLAVEFAGYPEDKRIILEKSDPIIISQADTVFKVHCLPLGSAENPPLEYSLATSACILADTLDIIHIFKDLDPNDSNTSSQLILNETNSNMIAFSVKHLGFKRVLSVSSASEKTITTANASTDSHLIAQTRSSLVAKETEIMKSLDRVLSIGNKRGTFKDLAGARKLLVLKMLKDRSSR